MNNEYCMINTTCDKKEIAEKIRESLLEKRLASCIQFVSINSGYYWDGEIQNTDEILLQIKTRKELYEEIEKEIIRLHDYDLPQIIMYDIQGGYSKYFDWIDEETRSR